MLYQFSNFSEAVNLNRKGRPWYEYAAIHFAQFTRIEKILNPIKLGHFYDWVCSRFDLDKCNYGAMLSGELQLKEIIPKDWVGNGVPLQFEDMIINGFDKTEEYLTYFYGDYMTPPPPEKRTSQHNVTKAG